MRSSLRIGFVGGSEPYHRWKRHDDLSFSGERPRGRNDRSSRPLRSRVRRPSKPEPPASSPRTPATCFKSASAPQLRQAVKKTTRSEDRTQRPARGTPEQAVRPHPAKRTAWCGAARPHQSGSPLRTRWRSRRSRTHPSSRDRPPAGSIPHTDPPATRTRAPPLPSTSGPSAPTTDSHTS